MQDEVSSHKIGTEMRSS